MKTVALAFLLALTPNLLTRITSHEARAQQPQVQPVAPIIVVNKSGHPVDGTATTDARVVVRVSGDPNNPHSMVFADGDGQAQVVKVVTAPDDQSGGNAAGGIGKKVYVVARANKADGEAAADQGWLGVTIIEAPGALADQLDIKENGVLIANVAKGSPADDAGFQVHDVILSIDGKSVGTEVGSAVELIRARKPGERLNVTVLRSGQQQNVSATLAQRPDLSSQKVEWKFEGPEGTIQERTTTHGKMLMRGPNGTWTMKDLGDLHGLGNLPPGVAQYIPQSGSKQIQVFSENGKRSVNIKVQNDGGSLIVEQKDGDQINVTRTDTAGQTTTATYADAEALRAADPEAADIYDQIDSNVVVNLGDMNIDVDVDTVMLGDDVHDQIQQGLGAARESYQKAMEELHKAMMDIHSKANLDADALKSLMQQHGLPTAMGFGKPQQSFEVRPDGTIEVRTRKGDSELVQLYQNEADLIKRNPEMGRKYKDLNTPGRE